MAHQTELIVLLWERTWQQGIRGALMADLGRNGYL